ncbi:hypothetical protein HAX54_020047, partial [Datura stramonium]|nr:hypothetical protein [Datura stramonium]
PNVSQSQRGGSTSVTRCHRGGALPSLLPRWFDRFLVQSFPGPFSSMYGFRIRLTNTRIGHLCIGNLTGCNKEYALEFTRLSKYALELVVDQRARVR